MTITPDNSADAAATTSAVDAAPSRRCWRCLQNFACDAADIHVGPSQWWLCDPCHDSLIGKH